MNQTQQKLQLMLKQYRHGGPFPSYEALAVLIPQQPVLLTPKESPCPNSQPSSMLTS